LPSRYRPTGSQGCRRIRAQLVFQQGKTLNSSVLFAPYCCANQENSRLKCERDGSDLQVIAVFKDIEVTKCGCPIEISGTISNLSRSQCDLLICRQRPGSSGGANNDSWVHDACGTAFGKFALSIVGKGCRNCAVRR